MILSRQHSHRLSKPLLNSIHTKYLRQIKNSSPECDLRSRLSRDYQCLKSKWLNQISLISCLEMSQKEKEECDRDSDTSEPAGDNQDNDDSQSKGKNSEANIQRTGLEAADIVEDALQLAVDDELNEDRTVSI